MYIFLKELNSGTKNQTLYFRVAGEIDPLASRTNAISSEFVALGIAHTQLPALSSQAPIRDMLTQWIDTKIIVSPGMTVTISATGKWSHGNEGGFDVSYDADGYKVKDVDLPILPAEKTGALIGRIDTGKLYLTINDKPGEFGNNYGTLTLDVSIKVTSRTTRAVLTEKRMTLSF